VEAGRNTLFGSSPTTHRRVVGMDPKSVSG
jgi:hypothetical protein